MRPHRRTKSSKRPRPKRRSKRNPGRLSKRAKRPAKARQPTQAKPPAKAKRSKAAKRKVRPERNPASALEREILRLRRARGRLERRLTEAVQEIGMLRQFETRVQALEAEALRRDAEIAELRRERDEQSREAGNFRGGASTSSAPS